MANPSGVGVYVDVDRVFVVELVKERSSTKLARWGEAPFTPVSPDLSSEGKVVSQALRYAVEKSGIDSKIVATALPARDCVVRYFDIPMIPKKEWADAVHFEAQKYVSLNLNDLNYSFKVFPDKKQKKLSIVFLASKKEIVQQHLKLLIDAGLKTHYLEPAPLSFVRALRGAKSWQANEVYGLIDLRSNGMMSVIIVKSDRILMERDSFILEPEGSLPAEESPGFNGFIKEIKLTSNFLIKILRAIK